LHCDISDVIKESTRKALNNETNHYTDTAGILELREAVTKRILQKDGVKVSSNNILICNGAKQCISNLLNVIVDDGDEIIIFNPSWKAYSEITKLVGGIPIYVELYAENGYEIDCELVERMITSKTKAIIVNNPNNPTGKIIESEKIKNLLEIAVKNNILLISDEVYREIVFIDDKFVSVNSLINDKNKNNIVVVDSISKSHAMTGWRVGYMNVPEYMVNHLKQFQSFTTSNINSLAQVVAIDAILNDESYIEQLRNNLKQHRDLIYDLLKEINIIKLEPKPDATFYVWAKIDDQKDSVSFCHSILENSNVALVPGIEFGREGYIRISFTNSVYDIKNGIENIKGYVNQRRI